MPLNTDEIYQSFESVKQPQVPNIPDIDEIYGSMDSVVANRPKTEFVGGLKAIGRQLLTLPEETVSAGISALQGQSGVDLADPDFLDKAQMWIEKRRNEREMKESEKLGNQQIIPGVKTTDVTSGLGQSLAFSGTTAGVGIGTGVATGGIAGTATALGTAYRMASNQIMRQYLNHMNDAKIKERGQGLTNEEEEALKSEFSDRATKYGIWEAVPEVAGGLIGLKVLTTPLKKMIGKNVLVKGLAKAAGVVLPEIAEETTTQIGQSQALAGTPLQEGKPLEFNLAGGIEAAKQVIPQTVLISALMGGVGAVGVGRYNAKKASLLKDMVNKEQGHKVLDDEKLNNIYKNFADIVESRPNDKELQTAYANILGEIERRKEVKNAEGIRKNEGRVQEERIIRPESKRESRPNLEQQTQGEGVKEAPLARDVIARMRNQRLMNIEAAKEKYGFQPTTVYSPLESELRTTFRDNINKIVEKEKNVPESERIVSGLTPSDIRGIEDNLFKEWNKKAKDAQYSEPFLRDLYLGLEDNAFKLFAQKAAQTDYTDVNRPSILEPEQPAREVPSETPPSVASTESSKTSGQVSRVAPERTAQAKPETPNALAKPEPEIKKAETKGEISAETTASTPDKATSPNAPTTEIITKEGKDKAKIESEKVIEPTKQEEATITTPKAQKKYLLDAIDDVMGTASKENPETFTEKFPSGKEAQARWQENKQKVIDSNKKKFGTVTIEVPNDGTFEILNTKQSLSEFKKQAQKFPVTAEKIVRQPSEIKPTGKRIQADEVQYYNAFKPRKQGLIEGQEKANGEKANYYIDGWYTNGEYGLITEKPKMKLYPNKAKIKDVLPKDNELEPIEFIGEFSHGYGYGENPSIHGITKSGKDIVYSARYIDSILTEHPNAKAYSAGETRPLVFKEKGKPVGIVMPKVDNDFKDVFGKRIAEIQGKPIAESAPKEDTKPISKENLRKTPKDVFVKADLASLAKQHYASGDLEITQYMAIVDLLDKNELEAVDKIIKEVEKNSQPSTAERIVGEVRITKAKGKANIDRMIKLLGAQMYKANLADVTIKEIIQNSFDAVKATVNRGVEKTGEISIAFDYNNRIIAVRDNGQGMTPRTIRDAFLSIGGTEKTGLKEGESSGGLGMAKTAFIVGNEWIYVSTAKNGIRSTFKATGAEIFSRNVSVKEETVPKEEHGTIIIVKVPKTIDVDGQSKDVYFPYSKESVTFFDKPLIHNDVVVRAGFDFYDDEIDSLYDYNALEWNNDIKFETIQLGKNFDLSKYTKSSSATFSWGKADIYIGINRVSNRWETKHEILSSGLFQFKDSFPISWTEIVPYNIIINVSPKVAAEATSYPFDLKREGWKETIKKDIEALKEYVKNVAQGIEASETVEQFKNIKPLPKIDISLVGSENIDITEFIKSKPQEKKEQTKIYIPPVINVSQGVVTGKNQQNKEVEFANINKQKDKERLEKTFKPDKVAPTAKDFLLDVGISDSVPIYHNNTNVDYMGIASARGLNAEVLFSELGSLMLSIKDVVMAKGGYAYQVLKDSVNFVGISIDKKYHGVNIPIPFKGIFLNPLAVKEKTLPGLSWGYYDTIVHEFAHYAARNHEESFTSELSALHTKLAADGTDIQMRVALARILKKHQNLINLLRDEYEKSTTKNIAKSLHESEQGEQGTAERVFNSTDGGTKADIKNAQGFADRKQEQLISKGLRPDVASSRIGKQPERISVYDATNPITPGQKNDLQTSKDSDTLSIKGEQYGQRTDSQSADQKYDVLPEVRERHFREVESRRSVISKDEQAPVKLRNACREGQGLKHYPEGYNNPEYQAVQKIASSYGVDVIPITDTSNATNAIISNKSIFLNMGSLESSVTAIETAYHELSHFIGNAETQQKIDTNSPAFKIYRHRLSQLYYGTDFKMLSVNHTLSEYAADIESGVESRYGVSLKSGLKKGETVETIQEKIGKKDNINEFSQPTKFSLKEAVKKITDNPNFKKWFGNSKVVDENSEPLVVYHGTTEKVNEFSPKKIGRKDRSVTANFGFFFTDDESEGNRYASWNGASGNTIPVYLSITNPYKMSYSDFDALSMYEYNKMKDAQYRFTEQQEKTWAKEAKKQVIEAKNKIINDGYDGIVVETHNGKRKEYVAFDPTQIKSIYNTGTFDPKNPDIRYSLTDTISGRLPRTMSQLQDWLEQNGHGDKAEKIATYLWDRDASIAKVQKSLGEQPIERDYILAKKLMGSAITEEIKELDKKELQPFLQHLADSGLSIADVENLAHAEHAPERNLQMKRVNARRYIDAIAEQMYAEDKRNIEGQVVDAKTEAVMDDASLKELQDKYVGILDKLAQEIISTEETVSAEIDAQQKALDNRSFTDEEINKGTPERLQKKIDNARDKLQRRLEIARQWEDVKDRLSGMTDEQAAEISNQWRDDGNMEQAVEMLRSINNKTLNTLLQSGEITPEEYDSMKSVYQKHVPLMREDFEDKRETRGRSGTGPLAKPLKIAYGSTKGVSNIFAHIVDRRQASIARKHELAAGKALYELVKANPDESRWAIVETAKKPRRDNEGNIRLYDNYAEEPNQVHVKIKGEKFIIEVPSDNPQMMRFIEAVKRQQTPLDPVFKASQKLTRLMASLNTYFSPEFLMTNFAKDLQTAMIHLEDSEAAGMQKKVFKNIKLAIKGIYDSERGNENSEWAKIYKQYSKLGGKIGWMQSYENIKKLADSLQKELEFKEGRYPNKAKLKKLGDWIGAMNTAVENGVRLATFKALTDSGVHPMKAAQTAKSLTVDFTQHGTAGTLINSLYMFANAGIQGNVRMIKALAKSKKVRQIATGIVGFGAIANFLGAAIGGDDEDGESYYDKLKRTNPGMFERNMVFMIPSTKGDYIKVPMPYGYNTFFVLGNEMASTIRGNSPIEAGANIVTALMGTLNPLSAATFLQTVTPTVLDPIAQVYENKAWHGGKLMPEKNPFGMPIPDSQRYFESVNPAAKYFTAWINSMTGGDKFTPGLMDVSPETVEMIFETYTGAAGRFAKDVLSIPVSAMSEDGLSIRQVPFARKIVGSSPAFVTTQIFQENRDKVDVLVKLFQEADTEERLKLLKDPMFPMLGLHKKTESQLRKLNKAVKLAEKMNKPEYAKKLKEQMVMIEKEYNKMYNKLEGK